jgi:death on curing protein
VNEVEYLELEDLLILTRRLGVGLVRDVGLLDAACARPRSSAFGVDAYDSIEAKAAALLHSLVRNHALVDGNKRLAWLAAVVFLDVNGITIEMEDDEAFELVMDASPGRLDVGEIAERLRAAASNAIGSKSASGC